MDIVRRPLRSGAVATTSAAKNAQYRDLVRALQPIEDIVGHPVPRILMGGGVVGMEIEREHLVAVCRFLRDELNFDLLSCISGVDMITHLEVVYHPRSLSRNWIVQIKTKLPLDNPEVDSVVGIWAAANWLERETYDLFGIRFVGHPDLRRILLDDDFVGHPLLKSFRPTPLTWKDKATTQADPVAAVSGEAQRGIERHVPKHLGQGTLERLHPGTPTFGHAHQDALEDDMPAEEPEQGSQ
jgi:NADH/F420H2 dehydrogenase subunit C